MKKFTSLSECNLIKEQTTSLIIASTCSVGLSPAFSGDIDGHNLSFILDLFLVNVLFKKCRTSNKHNSQSFQIFNLYKY